MRVFTEIEAKEWDEAVRRVEGAGLFMQQRWERAVEESLPFVSFRHYRYRDMYLVRTAYIGGRLTTAPFCEGSDVVPLAGTPLDHTQLQADLKAEMGDSPRLRMNERFAPLADIPEESVAAHEYVVDLAEPLLPRVRKTLRHILARPIEGHIERVSDAAHIDAAYRLYLRHMRSVRNFAMPRPLFDSLLAEHGGELWVWHQGDAPGAMAIFVPSQNEVLYSLSAADPAAFETNAPHHIVYAALEAYRAEGRTSASLGATGTGSALEVFKRGWRGEQYKILELGERSFGVGRTSRVRELAGWVPLSLYPLLTTTVGRHLL